MSPPDGTRRAEPAGLAAARAGLDRLSAGALGWIRHHLEFLDPRSAGAGLPTTPRVKAILQLAQLGQAWARVRPGDQGLDQVTATLRELCGQPQFAGQLAADRSYARQYQLMYCALAPAGPADPLRQALLARLAAAGDLARLGRSPYLRLELRYYAELAGVRHGIEPYGDLYAASVLARPGAGRHVTDAEACDITHTIFYLSAFGGRDPGLAPGDRERALRIAGQLTDLYVQRDEWDLAGKFLLTQFCLGADPAATSSGMAGIQRLAQVQVRSGAIPGRSAAQRAGDSAPAVEFFRASYQATLVAALASLIISPERTSPAPLPTRRTA
jgi:hypothetical protein